MSIGPFIPFSPFRVIHRLSFACLFTDEFTDAPVRSPLSVTIPQLRLTAFRSEREATYRFQVTNADVPTGPVDVAVSSLLQDYASFEPITVTLPIVPSTPPLRNDFLVTRSLWPTRRLALPPGETAVRGRVVPAAPGLAVAGLRVVLSVGPPPVDAPYTYTDAQGEFLFRLPTLVAEVVGGVVDTTETLTVTVSDGGAVTVAPATFTVTLGQVQFQQFTRS
jgi:hypothetical protein